MSHAGGLSGELFERLCEIDVQIADRIRTGGCGHCGGGRLHRADYPRKVRGVPAEAEASWARRISWCCSVDGCRRRTTPPSVRFLGRRVYAAVSVVMAVASCAYRDALAAPRRTVSRWTTWWRRELLQTLFWQTARADLAVPVEVDALPQSLLLRFTGAETERLIALLRFVAPVSTTSISARSAMAM